MLLGLLFADDLTLFSTSDMGMIRLLSYLKSFCDIFHLEVNVGKTEIVVFRPRKHPLCIETLHIPFAGHLLRVVPEAKYLGILLHEYGSPESCERHLVAAGNRARFALQARLRSMRGLSLALQITLFKNLVMPAMTYGCHIWGVNYLKLPAAVLNAAGSNSAPLGPFEDVWINYLRHVCGVGRYVPRWCLLQECGFEFVQLHFAKCATRFWGCVRRLATEHCSQRVAKADLRLMIAGNKHCWSHKLCSFLYQVGYPIDKRALFLFKASSTTDPPLCLEQAFDYFWSLEVDEHEVFELLKSFWEDRILLQVEDCDPRATSTLHKRFCRYVHWFLPSRHDKRYHACMYAPIPRRYIIPLVRLRLGAWTELEVHSRHLAFTTGAGLSGQCKCCNTACTQDELHVLFECPRFANLRSEYSDLFTPTIVSSRNARLFFAKGNPTSIARCIAKLYDWLCAALNGQP